MSLLFQYLLQIFEFQFLKHKLLHEQYFSWYNEIIHNFKAFYIRDTSFTDWVQSFLTQNTLIFMKNSYWKQKKKTLFSFFVLIHTLHYEERESICLASHIFSSKNDVIIKQTCTVSSQWKKEKKNFVNREIMWI